MEKQINPMEKPFNSGNLFFAGSLLFANIDFTSFYDGALRTAIASAVGGVIWLGIQELNDRRKERRTNKGK